MYGTSPIELLATRAMDEGKIFCSNYTYAAKWEAASGNQLIGNATVNAQTAINGDSDFIIQRIGFIAFSAAGTVITDPDYLIQINIGGSARQLFDAPLPMGAMFSNYVSDKVPSSLPFPYLLEMNNNLVTNLTNRTAVECNLAALVFDGFRVFYQGGEAPSMMRRRIFQKFIS